MPRWVHGRSHRCTPLPQRACAASWGPAESGPAARCPSAPSQRLQQQPARAPAAHLQLGGLFGWRVQRAEGDDALCSLQPALGPHIPGHPHCVHAGRQLKAASEKESEVYSASKTLMQTSSQRSCVGNNQQPTKQLGGHPRCNEQRVGAAAAAAAAVGPRTSIDLLQLCKLSLHHSGGDEGQAAGTLLETGPIGSGNLPWCLERQAPVPIESVNASDEMTLSDPARRAFAGRVPTRVSFSSPVQARP